MHLRHIFNFIGILIFFLGLSMSGPMAISIFYKDGSTSPLFFSMLITSVIGLLIFLFTRQRNDNHLSHRDGIAIVTFGWIAAGLFGTLPFLLSGSIPNFTNAYFESISGFTTTGASILTDIESLPK